MEDSVKYSYYEDSLAINCLLKQIEKDTIILSRGRRIESLHRVAKLDSNLLETYRIDIIGLTEDYNQCNRKAKRNIRFAFIGGLLIGLIPFILK